MPANDLKTPANDLNIPPDVVHQFLRVDIIKDHTHKG
jgi:hypothetical protein